MDWGDRWLSFVKVVIDPWVLALVAIGYIMAASAVVEDSQSTAVALTLMSSLIAGIIGGIVTNRWSRIADERSIVARGKVAVRSLKLLLANIVALDRRANVYLTRWKTDGEREGLTDAVVATYLEEVIGRCEVLEEEALSSIENWTDIVPEADIRTQVGLISDLKLQVSQLTGDLELLRTEKEGLKGQSEEREQQLRAEIAAKEKELRLTARRLSEGMSSMGSIAAGFPGLKSHKLKTSTLFESSWPSRKCVSCGFVDPPGILRVGNKCPKCDKDMRGEGGHFQV